MEAKHEKKCNPAEKMRHIISGSISRKLTFFVVVLCLLVVVLFWVFSVFMLQPTYHQSIRRDMSAQLNTASAVLDDAYKDGVEIVTLEAGPDGRQTARLSDECVRRLNAAQQEGKLNLSGRCLDIAGGDLRTLLLADNLLPQCVLHPSMETGLTAEGVQMEPERNGTLVTLMRAKVFEQGSLYETLDSGQMVMGRLVAGGQVSVIVTANLERIPQAVAVLKSLLLPISALLILFSLGSAWIFSRWFTRPVNRLSAAAKQMAKGNYDVQVEVVGDDEIADLSQNFNTMAHEVKLSSDLQRDLIANVSHDLRTPLTLIKGYAETVRDLTGEDPAKREEQLDVIVDEADRLSALVGSVMELSRMSTGHEKPKPVRFDLTELCDEMTYRYDAVCRQNGYTFEFLCYDRCEVVADPDLLERALHNLMGNALHHVGEDGFVGLRIYKTTHDTARVEVVDHGPGIPAKEQAHLFDKYYRSRADAGKPGTGLGLSITKAIFNAQDFEYGVESEVGKGSTFWFEVPLAPETKPEKKAGKRGDKGTGEGSGN